MSREPGAAALLQNGLKAHRAGHLSEAEACYRRSLEMEPDRAEALHLLGALFLQTGRQDGAVDLIRRAIALNGADSIYLFNLGIALQGLGRYEEAVAAYSQAIRIKPFFAEAHSNLGNALRSLGRLDEAVAAHRQAIAVKPDHAEALSNLGAVLRDQGRLDEAVGALRQAIDLKPDYAEAHSNLGAALHDQGRPVEAVAAYRAAIRLRPTFAEAHNNLAAALRTLGKRDEAVAAYHRAISINPGAAETHANLGSTLYELGRPDDAIAAFRHAIHIKPESAEVHSNLGVALRDRGDFDAAIAAYRQAIALKPDFAEAHKNLAMALREVGRLAEGRAALQQAVRLDPRNIKYRRYLGEIAPTQQASHLSALEELARNRASLTTDDRVELHFALANAYESLGRHAEAFSQWLDGNSLKRGQIDYDEAATLGVLDRTRTLFSSELLNTRQNLGHASAVPTFIIGMPRSGSTLVEQILASHPQVFGGDELTYFRKAVNEIRTQTGRSAPFPESVSRMTAQDFQGLGARYVAQLTKLAPAACRITDKMPTNFIFAGLIHLALPNSLMIHTVRDPVDTCLSCFSKLFAAEQNHTYNLAELGRYHRHYAALMAHWRRVLPPGRILDVRYEDIVTDLEGQARRIIAHCGLDWDPRCLAFHQTQRPVRTASAAEVRQPIYTTAVGRWRAYEPFLSPLLGELAVPGAA